MGIEMRFHLAHGAVVDPLHMRRGMRALAAVLGFLTALSLATPARAGGSGVAAAMTQLQVHFRTIEEGLLAGSTAPALADHAREMRRVLLELAETRSPHGQDPLWKDSLVAGAQSAGAIASALAAEPADLVRARAELRNIARLRDHAHERFRPGLIGRLMRWWKGRDNHKEKPS